MFGFRSQSQSHWAQLLPLGKFDKADKMQEGSPCAPQDRDEHPSTPGICTNEHSWWLGSSPSSMPPRHQGNNIRTPSQGTRGREKQLQSWVSSSGSEYEWGLCPPTLAHLGCNSACHEELRVQAHSCLTGCTRVMALATVTTRPKKASTGRSRNQTDLGSKERGGLCVLMTKARPERVKRSYCSV